MKSMLITVKSKLRSARKKKLAEDARYSVDKKELITIYHHTQYPPIIIFFLLLS